MLHRGKVFNYFNIKSILFASIILVIGYLLFLRFNLGKVRYLDIDEYAHMHWSYVLLQGEKPYTDFYYGIPPYFSALISPVFAILGRTVEVIIRARELMFVFYVFTLFSLMLFFKEISGKMKLVLTLLIFVLLPIPQDKMLEIRPDTISLAMSFLGMYFFLIANKKEKLRWYLLSGFFYFVSLGFIQKNMFFLVPPYLILLFRLLKGILYNRFGKEMKEMVIFSVGGVLALLPFLGTLIYSGDIKLGLYSITLMQSAVSKTLGVKYYIPSSQWFHPVDAYYGYWTFSPVYVANLFVWLIGSVWGILRLVSCFNDKDKNKTMKYFLMGSTFYINLYFFVKIIPLKHVQYLIPIAPFVSYYFIDFLYEGIIKKYNNSGKWKIIKILSYGVRYSIVLIFIAMFIYGHFQMVKTKSTWTMDANIKRTKEILSTIPADERVFDTTGEALLYKDGHYFCCLSYGQYSEIFKIPIPDIEKEMKNRGTKYAYMGSNSFRFNDIYYRDAKFVKENFEPIAAGSDIWKKR